MKITLITLLTLALFALASFTIAERAPEAPPAISFADDVWPIFEAKCSLAECHGPDGESPVAFNTYEDIQKKGRRINLRVGNRNAPMPPLQSGIRVSPQEVQTIKGWISAGMPNN